MWTSCAAVVFYQVDDGGHTWPGGPQYLPKAIIGPTTHAFGASEAIGQFFAAHAHWHRDRKQRGNCG